VLPNWCQKIKSAKQEIHMRQIIFATLMMLMLLSTNVACNTVRGFGEDVERAGEKTQDAANAVKKKL
jgi:predicted small secreted protein